MSHVRRIALSCAVVLFTAAPGARSVRAAGDLALTPPMGWNSWNKFGCNVSEELIKQTADAMVSTGMKDAGYQYVVIDDCWQVSRDADGRIVADPQRFPDGMKALADYVHSKGLKFGLYSDAGTETCQGRPGSKGPRGRSTRPDLRRRGASTTSSTTGATRRGRTRATRTCR